MELEYVVVVYSTVGCEDSSVMGPFSEEEALMVLNNVYQGYVEELEDEVYQEDYHQGVFLDDENLDKGFFSVRWSESEFVTFTLCKLQKWG